MQEQEPIRLKDSIALYLIQILRDYKIAKSMPHKYDHEVKDVLRASNEVLDDLLKKLGLCYGEFAPFELFLHPSSEFSQEAIKKYVMAYEEVDEELWTE